MANAPPPPLFFSTAIVQKGRVLQTFRYIIFVGCSAANDMRDGFADLENLFDAVLAQPVFDVWSRPARHDCVHIGVAHYEYDDIPERGHGFA